MVMLAAAKAAIAMAVFMAPTTSASELSNDNDWCSASDEACGSLVQQQLAPQADSAETAQAAEGGQHQSIIDMAKVDTALSDRMERFSDQAKAMGLSVSEKDAAHKEEMKRLEASFQHNLTVQSESLAALKASCNTTQDQIATQLSRNEEVLKSVDSTTHKTVAMRSWYSSMLDKLRDVVLVLDHASSRIEDLSAPELAVLAPKAEPPSAEEVMKLGVEMLAVNHPDAAPIVLQAPPSLSLLQQGRGGLHASPQAQSVQQLTDFLTKGLNQLEAVHQKAKETLREHFLEQYEDGQKSYESLLETRESLKKSKAHAEAEGTKLKTAEKKADQLFTQMKDGLNALDVFVSQVDEDLGGFVTEEAMVAQKQGEQHQKQDQSQEQLQEQLQEEAQGRDKAGVSTLQLSSGRGGTSGLSFPAMEDVMSEASDASTKLETALKEWEDRVAKTKESGEAALAAAEDRFSTELAAQAERSQLVQASNSELRKEIEQTSIQCDSVRADITKLQERLHTAAEIIQVVTPKFKAADGFIELTLNQTAGSGTGVDLLTSASTVAPPKKHVDWRSLHAVTATPLDLGNGLSLLQEGAGAAKHPGADDFDKTEMEQIEQLGERLGELSAEQQQQMANAEEKFKGAQARGEHVHQVLVEKHASLNATLIEQQDLLGKLQVAKAYLVTKLANTAATLNDVHAFLADTKKVLESALFQVGVTAMPQEETPDEPQSSFLTLLKKTKKTVEPKHNFQKAAVLQEPQKVETVGTIETQPAHLALSWMDWLLR